MRGKILFVTGGLVGYVLGARAGRKRYDQIAAAASNFWQAEPVQRTVHEVRDFALGKVGDTPATLFETGKKIVAAVQKSAQSGSKSAASAAKTAQAKADETAKAAADAAAQAKAAAADAVQATARAAQSAAKNSTKSATEAKPGPAGTSTAESTTLDDAGDTSADDK